MSSKTDTEVIIGGKVYTLSGYESEEYLQKVASYINNKTIEYGKVDSFRRQPLDTQNVLLQLNIADDYFKAKRQLSSLEDDLQAKEKELYDLKHELISSQIKLENVEKQKKQLQADLNDSGKEIIRLKTELEDALAPAKETRKEKAEPIPSQMASVRESVVEGPAASEGMPTVAEVLKNTNGTPYSVNLPGSMGLPSNVLSDHPSVRPGDKYPYNSSKNSKRYDKRH